MKNDSSRFTFDPTKHYSQVLMQQGRVQVDADWNEQQAITAYREETTTKDIIGACGAPIDDAGFGIAIATDGQTLTIGKGRFYVDGILCENDQADLGYVNQSDFPNPPNLLDLLSKAKAQFGIVYLDVWQRHITALDDDYIREKALGGPDTATRLKTLWQVWVLPVQGAAGDAPTCDKDFAEWDALVAPSSGTLNAHTITPASNDVCLIPPSAGYQRLENQLYCVEVHDDSASNKPTFKWSRDNGIVVTSITNISGQDVSVHDVGPDDVLGFANGQWVEVSDDSRELNGLPGELIQIQNVNAATKTITLQSAPALTFKEELIPKLRRWDGTTALTTNTWLPLEGGIEVQFSDGTYKTGDYWLIPARTATGEIEWPPFETPNANPIAQPPRGIQHHYCRLALLAFDGEKLTVQQDCRDIFPPLTGLPTEQAQAFHVTEIGWRNDDLLDAQRLLKDGLSLKFDAPPDPHALNGGAFIVTLEPVNRSQDVAGGSPGLRNIFVLEGAAQPSGNDETVVTWRANPNLENALPQFQDVSKGQEPRVRVRLMGSKIWTPADKSSLYLDGQVFGKAGMRADGQTPRIDLDLPSGSGARATDFESWFYLGVQTEPKPPLEVTDVRLVTVVNPFTGLPKTIQIVPQHSAQQPVAQIDLSLQQAQITFNRPPDPNSVNSNSVFVFTMDPATNTQIRMPASPPVVSSNIVTLTLLVGNGVPTGTLEVAGGADTPAAAVTAQDDGTALDGDYDNAAGGDFLLPFAST